MKAKAITIKNASPIITHLIEAKENKNLFEKLIPNVEITFNKMNKVIERAEYKISFEGSKEINILAKKSGAEAANSGP